MVVNGLVTSLIAFRILKAFKLVASTSVERSLGSTGGTNFRYIIFIIIESGMTLLVIQLVRMVLWIVQPGGQNPSGPVFNSLFYLDVMNEIFNVIIRPVHFSFFCFTKKITWLGHHTNNNFGTDLNEIVLR